MDKVIVTALLVMAGVISAITVFNAIYPMIGQSGDAITSMEGRIDDRLKTQIKIIYGTKSGSEVNVWIKNIGAGRIGAPEASDLFFGPEGNFSRIPYGSGTPHWDYALENDSAWNPTRTLKITIHDFNPLDQARYFTKLVLSNGVSDETFLSW